MKTLQQKHSEEDKKLVLKYFKLYDRKLATKAKAYDVHQKLAPAFESMLWYDCAKSMDLDSMLGKVPEALRGIANETKEKLEEKRTEFKKVLTERAKYKKTLEEKCVIEYVINLNRGKTEIIMPFEKAKLNSLTGTLYSVASSIMKKQDKNCTESKFKGYTVIRATKELDKEELATMLQSAPVLASIDFKVATDFNFEYKDGGSKKLAKRAKKTGMKGTELNKMTNRDRTRILKFKRKGWNINETYDHLREKYTVAQISAIRAHDTMGTYGSSKK